MASTDHGSARWMTIEELFADGYSHLCSIPLGYVNDGDGPEPISYEGEQHLVTVAPNRTGKGTSAIIPTLLVYKGGTFCIDPKGENAIVTANARRVLGQSVQILDPWGIAVDRLRDECGFDGSNPDRPPFERAAFNPLDMLTADSPDLTDDAQMIADALIVSEGGENSHWSTEAKAALAGFIMHVVTAPDEEGSRHLPRVRDIFSLPPAELLDLIERMAKSDVPAVRGAANRLMQKTEKELQNVMSTASANTHFLDSNAVRASLTHSSFDFGQLKDSDKPLSVYLVLPADRLDTHGRWLRLLVSMALTAVSRRKGKPKESALFILDEFAALGRLAKVEQAFGLMAGFGMRIWAILQDLSQLQDLYQKRWQTFLANAGVFQVFGVNDTLTAEYISRRLGNKTVEVRSMHTKQMREGSMFKAGDPDYVSMNDRQFARPLLTVDEVMKIENRLQIVFFSGQNPAVLLKQPYYSNLSFYDIAYNESGWIYTPKYTPHPDFPYDQKKTNPVPCGNLTEYAKRKAKEDYDKIHNPPRKKFLGLF